MPYNYLTSIDPFEFALDASDYAVNIAEYLDSKDLQRIGAKVVTAYDEDEASRNDWWKRIEKGLEMAMQVARMKTHPWQKASNVQFPSMSIAALNFHARALPALLPPKNLVLCRVMGKDPSGQKRQAAERINMHMTYQLRDEMPAWEEDHDRLLLTLSITGSEFKKTYFDPMEGKNVSKYVSCRDLVVNYYARDIETASRVTEVMEMTRNEFEERKRFGIYRAVDLGDPVPDETQKKRAQDRTSGRTPPMYDGSTPYMLLEQHTWLDLDGDGYKEPYVVVVEYYSGTVLRITSRYRTTDILGGIGDEEIIAIKPIQYYTHYIFLPSADGGFYGMGFGLLLGSLNRAVNTIVNQLIDAGTLSNMQSGFLSKNLQLDQGVVRFKPGEWKWVNALGRDLREGIFPLPTKEPSAVLFSMLELLISSGQQLSSTTDIMVGENPGQNQKATTTMAVVENGLKVITAIYKRIRRCMEKEYRKIYALNKHYMDPEQYFSLLDWTDAQSGEVLQAKRSDYQIEELQITPTADPTAISAVQRMLRAEALMQLAMQGLINGKEAVAEYLEALDVPQKERFLEMPPPQPNFDQQVAMEEQRLEEEKFEWQQAVDTDTLRIKAEEVGIKDYDAFTKRIVARGKIVGDELDRGNEREIEKTKLDQEKVKLKAAEQKAQDDKAKRSDARKRAAKPAK